MKSLLIQQGPGKFLQNCSSISSEKIRIIDIAIDNNLYQTFFRHKPDYCIFAANGISNEIVQFCQDYSGTTKIYFFVLNHNALSSLQNAIHDSNIKTIGYADTDIIIPPYLINDQLFYNKDNTNRTDGIVCFMEGLSSIINSMSDLLYPKTNIPIKMFNCPSIKHYQNLGMVTEPDKAALLQNHKYYLDINLDIGLNYRTEAIACGCIPITIEDIAQNVYQKKSIDNITQSDTITYGRFLKEILNYE